MARKRRIVQNKYPYHITVRTNNKDFRFDVKKEARELAIIIGSVFLRACKLYEVTLTHLVLMSNHLHFMVDTPQGNISRFMQYVDARIAERMNKRDGTTGHFWGGRFHSTVVSDEKYKRNVIRYMYQNPVRANLTDNLANYECSSICFYLYGKMTFVQITPDGEFVSFGLTEKERRDRFIREYLETIMTEDELLEVRKAMKKGIYGGEEFVTEVMEQHIESYQGAKKNEEQIQNQVPVQPPQANNLN